MRVAFDTNILVYAEGVNVDDASKCSRAQALVEQLPAGAGVIPVQVLGELFNVLVRKAGRTRDEARDAMLAWRDAFATVPTTPETMVAAADLAIDHQLGIWDAVVLAAAAQAGCRLLLTEDLHNGFTWGGVTVVDPFASPRHALLEAILS